MLGGRRQAQRDPVDADGKTIPQWGEDVSRTLAPADLVAAYEAGHFDNYMLGEDVESADVPQWPEQHTAEEVAQMSTEERVAALDAGRLVDYMAAPVGQPAGGVEL
ncbi:hypothetical protein AB0D14_02085 [Streptomyces sp. NPDC048484]|uniref:hypothetical protein n=1 Tax=Streptomyces sp. NPDC048484 TaxID=3155146 RepID=UPI00342F5EDC